MKELYTLSTFLLLSFFLGSCNLINPSEPVPTYIRVDSFNFTPNAQMGTSSHKITCVYAYLNNQSVGIYDLPATFPVIMDKKSRLLLTPGFDYNGFSGVLAQQPFYTSFSDSIGPKPGQVIHIKPTTGYYPETKLAYLVDFENSNPFSGVTAADTSMEPVTDPAKVFEGNRSGMIYLSAAQDSSVNNNSDEFVLPQLKDVYLEINYRSTVHFTIGMYTELANGASISQYIAGFNPRETWGKVYVDLKTFASTYTAKKGYTLILRAIKERDYKGKPGYVMVDNIKIVSF